jgi:hypothetical protein
VFLHLEMSRKTGRSSHHPNASFVVETLFFVVGSIVVSGDHLRLKMTLTARARLPMLATERRAHEAFGAIIMVAEKILHWKGEFFGAVVASELARSDTSQQLEMETHMDQRHGSRQRSGRSTVWNRGAKSAVRPLDC